MSTPSGYAVSLANLLLAVRYPFPLYTLYLSEDNCLPLRAALKLAPQLQAAQARRMEDVYQSIIRPDDVAYALRGNFAPELLCHNLSEQQLLHSLPVLTRARALFIFDEDVQLLRQACRAIYDHLGYAFFESAIHACVGHARVSQQETIQDCVHHVCNSFSSDILFLAQRYGNLMIRLHGAKPFLTMLYYWCDHQARVSQKSLVEAFDSPLMRAAAMILDHPNLSPIKSSKTVEAAFDALSLADRARLLLTSDCDFYNEHASSVEGKLRLLGLDPSIQSTIYKPSYVSRMNPYDMLVRYLVSIPERSSACILLGEACKQSDEIKYSLVTLIDEDLLLKGDLLPDEARMSLAQALINIPGVLHYIGYNLSLRNSTRVFARSLPDASLRAALEARLEWQERTFELSMSCIKAVEKLIVDRFGMQLNQLQHDVDIAEVYDAMLKDQAWLSVVDETVANIVGDHSLMNTLMNTMYGVSSELEQDI